MLSWLLAVCRTSNAAIREGTESGSAQPIDIKAFILTFMIVVASQPGRGNSMGMFDYLRCDAPLPDGRIVPGFGFQTKSLSGTMDKYTITSKGRLILQQRRFEPTEEAEQIGKPGYRGVEIGQIDLDYHRDIQMFGGPDISPSSEYVARFTHGTLEFIRPIESVSNLQRELLFKGW